LEQPNGNPISKATGESYKRNRPTHEIKETNVIHVIYIFVRFRLEQKGSRKDTFSYVKLVELRMGEKIHGTDSGV
jgi:hypothetical protein